MRYDGEDLAIDDGYLAWWLALILLVFVVAFGLLIYRYVLDLRAGPALELADVLKI